MRFPVLIGSAAILAACTAKDTKSAADSAAADSASASTFGSTVLYMGGIWNVNVKPEGRDTVVTTYLLNTTDSAAWLFAFPGGKPILMRVTGVVGDTVITETDWFDSNLRPGLKARSTSREWLLEDGRMMGRTVVHYQTTGPDTVRVFDTEASRKR